MKSPGARRNKNVNFHRKVTSLKASNYFSNISNTVKNNTNKAHVETRLQRKKLVRIMKKKPHIDLGIRFTLFKENQM